MVMGGKSEMREVRGRLKKMWNDEMKSVLRRRGVTWMVA